MEKEKLPEELVSAWIGLNGLLKDSRVTREMTYNEAVVMKLVYDQYRADGVGRTAVKTIVQRTNMLKSLVNRTVNALCQKGYLVKERGEEDARSLFVRPVEERLGDFLRVHETSLDLARQIIRVIGQRDAEAFVRICGKFLDAGDLSGA